MSSEAHAKNFIKEMEPIWNFLKNLIEHRLVECKDLSERLEKIRVEKSEIKQQIQNLQNDIALASNREEDLLR